MKIEIDNIYDNGAVVGREILVVMTTPTGSKVYASDVIELDGGLNSIKSAFFNIIIRLEKYHEG